MLHLAELYQCRYAILKERSPSCGSGQVYDGNFSATLVAGDGVLAAALKEKGITVIGESQIEKFFLIAFAPSCSLSPKQKPLLTAAIAGIAAEDGEKMWITACQ